MVLLFGFSENFLNPRKTNLNRRSIIALKMIGFLILGPGLVLTYLIKQKAFPVTLSSGVFLFYFKLAMWAIISRCRNKHRNCRKSEETNLICVPIFSIINFSLSLLGASIPTLTSTSINLVQIMGTFSILLSVDLVLISI